MTFESRVSNDSDYSNEKRKVSRGGRPSGDRGVRVRSSSLVFTVGLERTQEISKTVRCSFPVDHGKLSGHRSRSSLLKIVTLFFFYDDKTF